jgi:hypothetical protein
VNLTDNDIPILEDDDDQDSDPGGLPLAERALRRLRRIKWRMAENETVLIDAQMWLAAENAPLLEEAARLKAWLADWMAARLQADPRGPKTVTLPSGEVTSINGGLKVDLTDPTAFLAWASANAPALIRSPEPPPPPAPMVDKNAVKAAVGTALMVLTDPSQPGTHHLVDPGTGEAVPGVVLTRDPRSTKVRTA